MSSPIPESTTTAPPASRGLIQACCVLFAAKAALLLALAVNTRFVMDEFWQFGQAKYLAEFYDTIWPIKAVGYAALYLPAHWIGWDATSMLIAGRVEAALMALCTVGLTFLIARGMGEDRLRALVVVVVLLSFSTFMERAFRIRSEPSAILFATAALWCVVRHGAAPTLRAIFAAGLLSGLAFLCTQKAAYFNLALGLGLTISALFQRTPARAVRDGAILVFGWVLPIAGFCLWFGGADALSVARHLAFGPVDLAVSGDAPYSDLGQFVRQTLARNAGLYLLCFIGLALALRRLPQASEGRRIAALFTLVMAVLVFRHNQPWPYVFTMVLPALSLWAPEALRLLPATRAGATVAVAGLALLAGLGLARNLSYFDHDNRAQLAVVRQAEAFLPEDGTYFDGIGMLPNRREAPRVWIDAAGRDRILNAGEDSDTLRALREAPPDLVIETYRTDRVGPVIGPLLSSSYAPAAPGILLPGAVFRPGETVRFVVPKAGTFDLYGGTPDEVLIDGRPATFPLRLEPGPVALTLRSGASGATAPRLLPEGLTLPEGDPDARRQPLFLDVYTR